MKWMSDTMSPWCRQEYSLKTFICNYQYLRMGTLLEFFKVQMLWRESKFLMHP
jgi:hypothetical protein